MAHSSLIYLDHAATTPTDPRVVEAMAPYWTEQFGNPSSAYSLGEQAKEVVEAARLSALNLVCPSTKEVIFTGSGTESDNLAVLGVARGYQHEGRHIIVSAIDHEAVLKAAKHLELEGFEVSYAPVDHEGIIDLAALESLLRSDTILLSIMYANNEIGTIQPLEQIANLISTLTIFHTDACQAAGYLPLDVEGLGVDLLTFNGSKIYGPKGIGALVFFDGLHLLQPLTFGGGQERGMRSGTENVPAIIGLTKALELVRQDRSTVCGQLSTLRDWFIAEIERALPDAKLNGHRTKRLPNNINFTFDGVEAESLVRDLDAQGICVATGSACTTRNVEPSHVILALGVPKNLAYGTLRMTLGRSTTREQLQRTLEVLVPAVKHQQNLSPKP